MSNDPAPPDGTTDPWAELPDLLAASESNHDARHPPITLLYPELNHSPPAHMRRERRDHTLQAPALVSEFFVHLANGASFTARPRAQFLMGASIAMGRLLVDSARSRAAEKRGGERVRADSETGDASPSAQL